MEKIPAASAMDWSINLDRSLRSRHPDTRLRALDAAAPRLRDLSACPSVPTAVASAFGVLPAEPRLLAETMLLRLATEFRTADDSVRARIVRSLLVERRTRGWLGLARSRVAEPDQILRRVAAVYDTGGSTRTRALALRMFGCLADIAKDSVHVRSLILSALCSSCAAEVKAALFAAACFCKLSEDFSCIILQVLARLVTSPTSEAQVIIAAIKAFSELDCTLAVIRRVHEVGKQMVLGTLEDAFKTEMLMSLSRLSTKSIILFGDQVQFLSLFLGHDSSLYMKTMALKCLYFMFRRNAVHLPAISTTFGTLLQLVDEEDFPLECKSYTFRILQKILCSKAPSIHHINASKLSKLALAAENSLNRSSWEVQGSALEILVDIFCILKQAKPRQTISTLESSSFSYSDCQGISDNMASTLEENNEDRSVNKIITAIVYRIISLVNQVISNGSKEVGSRHIDLSSSESKYRALFSLMLELVTGYPSAASVALDELRRLITELARIHNNSVHSEVDVSCSESSVAPKEFRTSNGTVQPVVNSKSKASPMHDLIRCTLKFANACHDMCCKTSGASCKIHHSVKGLIECVQQNASLYCNTYVSFHLILCACISWTTCKIRDGNQESGDSNEHPGILCTPSVWMAQEYCALRLAKILTRKQSYWEAYRSAMYCCREGLWFTASFVFRKVADAFESGSFSFWFKSLLLFSAGEIEMKLLLFPSTIIKLVGELKTEEDLHEDLYCVETDFDSIVGGSSELLVYQGKVTGTCEKMCLANGVLSSNASSDCEFLFQRWFISLRVSFLEILTDVLDILSVHSSAQGDICHHEAGGDPLSVASEHNNNQLSDLVNCSVRLSDLTKSYDLLALSHGDIDHTSFTSIARLAFMCSLLSFCTAFSVDFSKVARLPPRFSDASIVQDLHERVDMTDGQIVSQLRRFMPISSHELDTARFNTRMNCSGNLEKDSYFLCKFAVASLLRVRGDAKGVTNGDDNLSPLHRRMQFLSSIFHRFMELPFVVPKYFFSVRPCLGAELFMFDSNPANRQRISISPGFQLSLTLCLQWKRMLERTSIRIAKLYCVIAASSSSSLDIAGTRSKEFEIRRTAEMVGLNTMLLQHIKNDLRKTGDKKNFNLETDLVTTFACFEPAGNGQGFSYCLLDVSSFPEGSYQIVWQACCVDENGSYFSLLPLTDGVVFSVQKS